MGTYFRVPGQVGGAVSFGGTSWVDNNAPAPANFPTGTGARTMAAWIKLPAPVTSTGVILDHDDFSMQVVSGGVLQAAVTGVTRVDDGKWHHVAAVYYGAGGNFSLYVDGQLIRWLPAAMRMRKTAGNWNIGQGLGGVLKFPGTIDEVRYYSRALSTGDIQAIMTGDGGMLAPAPLEFTPDSSLVSWWRLRTSPA